MKNNILAKNARLVNFLVGAVGLIFIFIAIFVGVEKTLSVVLLSIGTSIFATAIVTHLNSYYIIRQNEITEMIDHWGIEKIYSARAEINAETNEALRKADVLDICAMGLKGFRDAQSARISERISKGMRLRILTIDPQSEFLRMIDETEVIAEGSTRTDILTLLDWIEDLRRNQRYENQIEIRLYDHYPFDFYFCIDGTVYTGPYQAKTSQQTITYKFSVGTNGANAFKDYFESLWEKYSDG